MNKIKEATALAETLRRDLSAMETQLHEAMDAKEEADKEITRLKLSSEHAWASEQKTLGYMRKAEAKLREVEEERDEMREDLGIWETWADEQTLNCGQHKTSDDTRRAIVDSFGRLVEKSDALGERVKDLEGQLAIVLQELLEARR